MNQTASTMSLTRERGTLIAFASLIDADAHRRQKLTAQNLARMTRVTTAAPEWTAGEIYLPSIDIRILSKSGCRPRDGCPSSGAFRKLALPCERVDDDGLQIVKARLPYESGTDPVARGHDLCRVARPPRCELDLEVDARNTLDSVDHVQHRKTAAVTAIERHRSATVAQIGERIDMRCDEIGDVNIIPDAGAIRRRVVGAEDIHFRPPPERRFDRDLDEMGGRPG